MGPKSVSALGESFYTKTSSSRVTKKVPPMECRYLEHWSCYIIDVDADIIYWILIKSALNLIFEMLLKTFSRYIRGFIFFVSSFLLCTFVMLYFHFSYFPVTSNIFIHLCTYTLLVERAPYIANRLLTL